MAPSAKNGRTSIARLRPQLLRITAGMGFLLSAASCDNFVSPSAQPQTYVLTSIGGTPVDSFPNLVTLWAPDDEPAGAEITILADTVFLHVAGRGESRRYFRWRARLELRPAPDTPAQLDTSRAEFHFFDDGRYIRIGYRAGYERLQGGALQSQSNGLKWHYERVSFSGAP